MDGMELCHGAMRVVNGHDKWVVCLREDQRDFTYKTFIEMFFHPTMSLLSDTTEPRINEEMKRIMQLADQARIGDWYLYQNYIELRIYGCELAPYKLPKFPPHEDICTRLY